MGNVLRDARRKVSESLTELMDNRNSQLGDLPDIISKRDELSKQIQEQIKLRNTFRDEKREAEKAYNDYLNELRRVRIQKQQEERNKKQAEFTLEKRKREAEKLDEQPFVSEMTLIEQTILWCKTLTQSKDDKKDEGPKEIQHANTDGLEALVKKEDRDEYYYAPTAKGKKGKTNKKAIGADTGGSKPIKHNAETFKLFDQLKISPPITTGDLPPTLELLEKQLDNYKEKLKEWEITREEKKKKILEGIEELEKE